MADISPAGAVAIARAAALLQAGRLVAFPTETVYGLGGDATNDHAVTAIFAAKARPRFNPLIVHVRDLAEAETLAVFNSPARHAAARFWPGPPTPEITGHAGEPLRPPATRARRRNGFAPR